MVVVAALEAVHPRPGRPSDRHVASPAHLAGHLALKPNNIKKGNDRGNVVFI